MCYLVLVHPYMGQPQGIMGHGVLSPWGAIWSPLPEDVADSGAWDDEKLTTTHPDLQGGGGCRGHANTPC